MAKKVLTSKEITDRVINFMLTCIGAFDPSSNPFVNYNVSYNLDTRCYVIVFTDSILLNESFYEAFAATLKGKGINVNYIFIKVDAI